MGKNAYIGVNGVARKIKAIYVGVNGVAQKVKKAYIGAGAVAREWWGDIISSVLVISYPYQQSGWKRQIRHSNDHLGTINTTDIIGATTPSPAVYDSVTEKWYTLINGTLYSFTLEGSAMTQVATGFWHGIKDGIAFQITTSRQIKTCDLATGTIKTVQFPAIQGTIQSASVQVTALSNIAKDSSGTYSMGFVSYKSDSQIYAYRLTFKLSGTTPTNTAVALITTNIGTTGTDISSFFNGTDFVTFFLNPSKLVVAVNNTQTVIASNSNFPTYFNQGCFAHGEYYYVVSGGANGSSKTFYRASKSTPSVYTQIAVTGGYDSTTSPFFGFTADESYIYASGRRGEIYRGTSVSSWTQISGNSGYSTNNRYACVYTNLNNDRGSFYTE